MGLRNAGEKKRRHDTHDPREDALQPCDFGWMQALVTGHGIGSTFEITNERPKSRARIVVPPTTVTGLGASRSG